MILLLVCINKITANKMEETRKKGIMALECILNNPKNIKILENNVFIISSDDIDNYNRIMLQIIGDVISGKKLNDILKDIKSALVGWKHHSYNDAVIRLEEQDDFIEHPFQVEEGVLECKCGSKKVFSFSKQTRSADEPMTTYVNCLDCGNRWKC